MTDQELIKYLADNNDKNYNLLKASEECQELSLILTQLLSKGASDKDIIEEIGDVLFRVDVLKHLFDINKINERKAYKINKCKEYIQQDKYKNYT